MLPTNNGKPWTLQRLDDPDPSVIRPLRRKTDRPPTLEDSVRMIGWLFSVLVCLGVLAALFLGAGK